MNKETLVGDVINDCSNHDVMELKVLRGSQMTWQVLKADIPTPASKHENVSTCYSGKQVDRSQLSFSLKGQYWRGGSRGRLQRRNLEILPGLVGMISGKPNATWS